MVNLIHPGAMPHLSLPYVDDETIETEEHTHRMKLPSSLAKVVDELVSELMGHGHLVCDQPFDVQDVLQPDDTGLDVPDTTHREADTIANVYLGGEMTGEHAVVTAHV